MTNSRNSSSSGDFAQFGAELRKKAVDLGEDVREIGKMSKDMAGQKAHQWEAELEERIRRNPLQSLLIAAGVGLVLGTLWRKR